MKTNVKMKALKCAFPHTIPIMTGFLFLGMSYGIYMHVSGFSFWYPMLMAMTIFAGSVEFVCVNFLLGAFDPLQAFIVTLILNARHIFYGISMLDRFKRMGWKKIYLILALLLHVGLASAQWSVSPEVGLSVLRHNGQFDDWRPAIKIGAAVLGNQTTGYKVTFFLFVCHVFLLSHKQRMEQTPGSILFFLSCKT